jgi:hypothetical protein
MSDGNLASILDSNQAMLELTVLSAETSGKTFDDVVLEGLRRDIPPELLTRMKSLWETTKTIGNETIEVGKIIVLKIVEFLKANPKLAASLALGASVYLLSQAVPVIGPILAPLLAAVTTIYAFGSIGTFDDVIKTAKEFFAMLVSIFNAVAARWSAAL